jgi:4-amino-4-deoxy-L-arabinose transferase-like glycosyltransferase
MTALFREEIRKRKWELAVFALILVIGIFFRTYHFHDWLTIRDDQARDATLVNQVISGEASWPLMGPFMSYSGEGAHSEEHAFHLGPFYTYVQILSAMLFGGGAATLGYADALFGILTVALFYPFLRILFAQPVALALTGVFALSSYFIQFSRFSWNTNLIPFFVLLFLFSLHFFRESTERMRWRWAVVFGIALGLGIQLHVLVLIAFLLVTAPVAVYSLWQEPARWRHWVLVLLVVSALNVPQIVNEMQTDFSNTKILFQSSGQRGSINEGQLITLIRNGIDCQVEANAFFLTASGRDSCTYDVLRPSSYMPLKSLADLGMLVLSLMLTGGGYILFVWYAKREPTGPQKRFYGLMALYLAVVFVIMIPLSKEKFSDVRYLTPLFFLPFVLFGVCMRWLSDMLPRLWAVLLVSGCFLGMIVFNGEALAEQFLPLLSKTRTCTSHFTTLGEVEPVADYILAQLGDQKTVASRGDQDLHVLFPPLAYLLGQAGVASTELNRKLDLPAGIPAYLISCKLGWREQYPYVQKDSFFVIQLSRDTVQE